VPATLVVDEDGTLLDVVLVERYLRALGLSHLGLLESARF
jgi:hypothetical protein